MTQKLAVVGLWHLGCTIAACWARLGWMVEAIDPDERAVAALRRGEPPLYEPLLRELLREALSVGMLRVSESPRAVTGCRFVFFAHDVPVSNDDKPDVSPVWSAVEACGPYLDPGALVVVSAQVPVGMSVRIRERLKDFDPSLEVVYSPENLRLGESVRCYMAPGHIVIGAEDGSAGDVVEKLFAPMRARHFRMNLASAEMVKHCINSFLATSVTLANQWSDIADAVGADFRDIAGVLRAEPRIGDRAYITPGIGFSGGTLGRDLRVLDDLSRTLLEGQAPLFGQVWHYNQRRVELLAEHVRMLLESVRGDRVALFGMTYKPGTSTLRRSLPLALARRLLAAGVRVSAHDPRADWTEIDVPKELVIAQDPYEAADGADLAILLTEWPQYADLDFARLARSMRRPILLDPTGIVRRRTAALAAAGLTLAGSSHADRAASR